MKKIGFACVTNSLGFSTNHTLRLKNLTFENIKNKSLDNLNHLNKILQWMSNTHPSFRLFRIGSSFIPFKSHPEFKNIENNKNWIDFYYIFKKQLNILGNTYNDFTLSFHPGQYCILNSPNSNVVKNAIDEIKYNHDVLKCIGLPNSKIVIHIGGRYDSKQDSIVKFIENVSKLSEDVKNYIVIENDDKIYNFNDIMFISKETGILPILDVHHELCNESENFTDEFYKFLEIWANKGKTPKIHISSPRNEKQLTAHNDYILTETINKFNNIIGSNIDIMVEAKAKEDAVIKFINELEKR